MKALLLALLLAGPSGPKITTLYDDAVRVGPGRIRTLDIALPVEPARIVCSYEVVDGGSGVRLVLLKQEDAARWLRGEAHEVQASTSYARRSAFSFRPAEPDHYLLVLDNRLEGRMAAEVQLQVRVVEDGQHSGPVRPADRRKGRILVFLSMGAFAGVAGLFAFKLWKNGQRA